MATRNGATALLADGRVATVFEMFVNAEADTEIALAVLNGAPQNYVGGVSLEQVNTSETGNQLRPVVAGLTNGNIAVAWFDDNVDRMKAGIFNILGIGLVGEIDVTPVTGTDAGNHTAAPANITSLEDGGFAISWEDVPGESRMSIYDSAGSLVAGEIDLIVGGGNDDFTIPGVAQLADGRLVAVAGSIGGTGLNIRFFSEAGVALTSEIAIALPGVDAAEDSNPRIAALQDGRFMVVTSRDTENATDSDIWGVIVKADGTIDGTPFQVNDPATHGVGSQSAPAIVTLADGRVIVSWTDDQSGSGEIFTKIYDPREAGLRGGASSLDDDWFGTTFNDTVFLGAGKDTFRGGGAADFIFGEAGSDTLYGEDSDDRIDGGTGADTMIGGIGNDIYSVDNVNDVTSENAGEGIDTVRATLNWTLAAEVDKLYILGSAISANGNDLSNFIYGNANANQINGGLGADRMFGGAGDDTFQVDSAGDLIFETIAGAGGGLNDLVQSTVNHTLSNNVELLTLTGLGNINGTGNSLGNTINGNGGNNFIDGKGGNDTLIGQGGSDQFLFTTALNAANNVDIISDFDPANDFLRLDDAIFTQIATGFLSAAAFHAGTAATTAAHRIIYNSATGDVFYDANGVGGAGQIKFANVGIGTALTQADIFVF
ncbi:MAG: calcium-binding protein [Aestuariivirga sp.]